MMDRAQRLLIRLELEALNAEFAYRVDHGPTATVADRDCVYGKVMRRWKRTARGPRDTFSLICV